MFKLRINITLALLGVSQMLYCQANAVRKLDAEMTRAFKMAFLTNQNNEERNLPDLFLETLKRNLYNVLTFENTLDSLSKYMTIRVSGDKKIKFYSWDDQTGGTWHNINCIAQFITDKGIIAIQSISTGEEVKNAEYTDSQIYSIKQYQTGGIENYLTFGWGTHGGGLQHEILQIFTVVGDSLVKCGNCFTVNMELVVVYPRSAKLDLKYDSEANSISFAEFRYDKSEDVYRKTGKAIRMVLKGGRFIYN